MKRVNIYTNSKAQDTDRIKSYLTNHGVDFRECDVDTDMKAHKRMLEATRGACGTPVVEIGNQIVCGFDRQRLEDTIAYELR